MKFRYAFLFLAAVLFASIASAECLSCHHNEPPFGNGTCRPTAMPGYCSGECCYLPIDSPCPIPDLVYECDPALASTGAEKAFFATKRPQQIQYAAIGLRFGDSLKGRHQCAASKLTFG